MAPPEPENDGTKPLQRFSVLGLDTSALISANWPYPSVDLDNIVSTCRELGVPVLIPDLVLVEARVITLEKTADAIQRAKDSLTQTDKRLPGTDFGSFKWPSRNDRENVYDASVKELQQHWGGPVPTRNSIVGKGASDGVFKVANTQLQNLKCEVRHLSAYNRPALPASTVR